MLVSQLVQALFPLNAVVNVFIFCCSGLASADYKNIRIARMSGGDLLAVEGEPIDCRAVNAEPECNSGEDYSCNRCRCEPPHSTFVESASQCMTAPGMLEHLCQLAPPPRRQHPSRRRPRPPGLPWRLPMLRTTTDRHISRRIMSVDCNITNKNPEVYLHTGTWLNVTNATFSLQRQREEKKRRKNARRKNGRGRSWEVTFTSEAISELLSKYAGHIGRISIRCGTMNSYNDFEKNCLVFKIAGTLSVDKFNLKLPHRTSPPSPTLKTRSTSAFKRSTLLATVSTSPGNQKTDPPAHETGGKNSQLIWIISPVLVVVIIVLIGVILFIHCRHRKADQSNSLPHGPSFMLNDRGSTAKSPTQAQQEQEDNLYGDHIYATIAETNADLPASACPITYQELHIGGSNPSSYEPLVHQEVQYVDILSDSPAEDTAGREMQNVDNI